MSTIEPNIAALAWFCALCAVASLGFYVVIGAFPLATRPDLGGPLGITLALVDAVLLVAVLAAGLAFGIERLRWTSVVIVAACAFLFSPALFNLLPQQWRDGRAGLAIVMAGLGAAIILTRVV